MIMIRIFFLTFFFISIIPSASSAQEISVVNLFGGVVKIGQGYDTETGQPLGYCVERNATDPKWNKGEEIPQEVFFDLDVLTNREYERRFSSMTIGGGGSYGGLFKASGSYASSSDVEAENTSFHIVFSVEVRNLVETLSDFKLLPSAITASSNTAASSGTSSAEGGIAGKVERKKCGDSFVYGIARGGILHLVATVKTNTLRARDMAMKAVSASGSYAGISASASASFYSMTETARTFASTRVRIFSQGPWPLEAVEVSLDPKGAETALKSLVQQALRFPSEVNNETSWVYRGYLMPYSAAGETVDTIEQEIVRRTISSQFKDAADRYWSLQKYLGAVQLEPSLYVFIPDGIKLEDLPKKRATYIENWQTFLKKSGDCRIDVSACTLDTSKDSDLFPTIATEKLPGRLHPGFASAICSDLDRPYVFPGLFPARVGCFDTLQSAYWAGPVPDVLPETATLYCSSLEAIGTAKWRLPTREELLLLFASQRENKTNPDILARATVMRNEAPISLVDNPTSIGTDPETSGTHPSIWFMKPDGGAAKMVVPGGQLVDAGAGTADVICLTTIGGKMTNESKPAQGQ